MNRSIPAFVLSLIFGLVGAIVTYLFWIVFILVGAFSNGLTKILLNVVPILNIAMFVIIFIGSFFCLKRPQIGGAIITIASILSLICLIIICIVLKTFNFIFIICWLPSIITLIAGIIAIKSKKVLK